MRLAITGGKRGASLTQRRSHVTCAACALLEVAWPDIEAGFRGHLFYLKLRIFNGHIRVVTIVIELKMKSLLYVLTAWRLANFLCSLCLTVLPGVDD